MINLYLQKISSIKTFLLLLFIVPFVLLSCSSGHNSGGGNGSTLQSISIYSPNSLLHINTTEQIIATGIYSNGTTQDISRLVTWSSSNSSVLSVGITANNQGVVTAITAGSNIVITATLNGISGSTIISSSASPLQSITIINPVLIAHVGVNVQLTAIGIYSDGSQDITNNATWSSSLVNIATITSNNNSGGLVNPVAAGSTQITASFSGQSTLINLTVSAVALSSISVSPSNSTTHLGINQQFTATAVFADSLTQNITGFASWSSSASSIATITSGVITGGLAVPVSAGSTTITATLNNISGATNLTVSNSALKSITLNLSLSSHLHKQSKLGISTATTHLGVNQQFIVTAVFNDGTTQNVTTSAIWSSSNLSVANVSNASGSQGLAVPIATGATVISASLLGQTGSVTLTVSGAVLQSIAITPSSASVALRIRQQYVATATFADGTQTISNSAIWLSSNQSIASVSSTGLAYPNAIGSANISAVLNGVTSNTSTLTVTAAVLSAVGVSPISSTLAIGSQQQFTANGIFSDGSVVNLTSSATWNSANTSIAAINNSVSGNNGLATAIGVGSTTITASYSGISSSASLNVSAATVTSISIVPSTPLTPYNGTLIIHAGVGLTNQFIAQANYSDGSTQNVTSSATWTSSNATVVPVSSTGLVSALVPGTGTITATVGSTSGTVALTSANFIVVTSSASGIGGTFIYSCKIDPSTLALVTCISGPSVGGTNTAGGIALYSIGGNYYGLYMLNIQPGTAAILTLNNTNGSIPTFNFPVGTFSAANSLGLTTFTTTTGNLVGYVSNGNANTNLGFISSFNTSTGVPAANTVLFTPVAGTISDVAVFTSSSGSWLIAPQLSSSNIYLCPIIVSTGAVSTCTPSSITGVSAPQHIAVNNGYLYVVNNGLNVQSCLLNSTTGAIGPCTTVSGIAAISNPYSIAFSPNLNSQGYYTVSIGSNTTSLATTCFLNPSNPAVFFNCNSTAVGTPFIYGNVIY